MNQCSICSCEFSLDDERGVVGEFGILPVQFCSTCLVSLLDMADQLTSLDDEALYFEELSNLAEYHGIDSLYESGRDDFINAILEKVSQC